MRRVMALIVLLCFCLPLPVLATESAEEAFVNPTRSPTAPEYSTSLPEDLQIDQIVARAFVLMERTTGEILMQKNADLLLQPASTTKLLTALMALQFGNLDDVLVATPTALTLFDPDATVVPFKQGEMVTLQDVLYGLLLKSGNEAANMIAEYVAGDVPTFVQQMNVTAQMLGATNTHFNNANGLPDELHVTTARDMALIMDACLQNETLREIVGTWSYTLSATEMNPARTIYNLNLHLDRESTYYYRYSIGGKTGFTMQAGYTLVEAARKDGVELIAVILYSGKYSRWPDVSRLFAYGFTKYKSVTPDAIYREDPVTLQLSGFSMEDSNIGRLLLDIRPLDTSRDVRIVGLKADVDAIVEGYASYTNIRWTRDARAPIQNGDVMGILTYYPDRQEPAEYELFATRAVAAREDMPLTLEEIEQRVLSDPSPLPPFGLSWILPPILGVVMVYLVLRGLLTLYKNRRKHRKQIPDPKRRYFR